MHRRNYYPKHVSSWVILNPQTTVPSTNRPPTTYPPIHRPLTQRLAKSIIIPERCDNRNRLLLQNTSTAGKTYNFTSIYYPKSFLVSIKYIRRNSWNFQERFSFRTLPDNYFWLFKYVKVGKNLFRYCNKDIKMLSIQAIFVTLKMVLHVEDF